MRKYIILALILTCISAGSILWAHTDMDHRKDDITVKETVEAGKQDATEGVKISTKVQDNTYKLNWNTDLFLDGSGDIKSETEFIYDRNHEIKFHDVSEDHYVAVERFQYDVSHLSTNAFKKETGELLGTGIPIEMIRDAYAAAGDREVYTWKGCLDDYTDYLPVEIYTECPDYDHTMLDVDADLNSNYHSWTNYFQMPVPKNFGYELKINKHGFEGLIEITKAASDVEESYYTADSDGFWDGENLYIAISGMEEEGSGEIFVECPDEKRGIHTFPTEMKPYPHLKFAQGELVYPIASGLKVIDLIQSQDEKTLYLLTKGDNGLCVDIIDKETMNCRQKVQLSKNFEHTADFQLSKVGEDWVLYSFGRGDFILLAEEKGIYEEVIENTVSGRFYESEMDCVYDGKRLAVVTIDDDSVVVETQLRIFDETGCVYRGRFDYDIARSPYDEESETSEYMKRVYVEFTDEI